LNIDLALLCYYLFKRSLKTDFVYFITASIDMKLKMEVSEMQGDGVKYSENLPEIMKP